MKSNISLRMRLTIWYSAIVVFSLALFGVFTYFSISNELRNSVDQSLIATLKNLEFRLKNINRSSPKFDFSELFSVNSLVRNDNFYYQIKDESKDLIAGSSNISETLPTYDEVAFKDIYTQNSTKPFISSITLNNEDLRLLTKFTGKYYISIAYSLNDNNKVLTNLFVAIILSTPIILIISIFGGILLAKLSLRPIDKINQTANEITAKNLSWRLPDSFVDDEIGRLTRTLNKMIERLQLSFNQTEKFTSDASHELRTPLTILKGELEIALHSPRSGDDYELILASSLEEVNRLVNVVETLLELSRAESGQIKMNLKLNSLTKLMLDIAEDAEMLAEGKDQTIETHIEGNLFFNFDSPRLHQAILNIVENAIKYTPQGGKVLIDLYSTHSNAIIKISDTGIGIPEEHINHIFDRFFRANRKELIGIKGTGLGLAIVHWIVDSHNGRINVTSKVGQGTTFELILPKTAESN